MSKKKLVVKDRGFEVEETITVETARHEIEIPAIEGRAVVKAFVNRVMEDIKKEYGSRGEKMNSTALMIENSDLLDEEENKEVLAYNKQYAGEFDAFGDVEDILYTVLDDFTSD